MSRKRRTTSVDERRSSPRPSTWAGQAITTSSPRAAACSASRSPASLESAYGMPIGPERSWRSSAAPCGGAGPIAATEETWTTRATPSASAASSAVRAPSALMRKASSAARRRFVVPATWKSRSAPLSARRIAARSVMSAVTQRTGEIGQRLAARGAARGDRHVVAAGDEPAGELRSDEAGPAGHDHLGHPPRTLPVDRLRRHARRRRRHGFHSLPPARGRQAPRPARGLAVPELAGPDPSRGRHHRLRRVLRRAARGERAAEHVAAVGRRLHRLSTSRCSRPARTSSRSTSPAGSRGPCRRPSRRARP